ncbi:MAG: TylF/MycF/NovP-related O-methyltransferase, partial [Planctomycetota bacterium]
GVALPAQVRVPCPHGGERVLGLGGAALRDAEPLRQSGRVVRPVVVGASGASKGLGGETYYGYVDDLEGKVRANLARFGVEPARDGVRLHRGLFEDTLRPEGAVALAHFDCDWYESVRVCIERDAPHVAVGGLLVFAASSSCAGWGRAVADWRAPARGCVVVFHRGSLGVRRRA